MPADLKKNQAFTSKEALIDHLKVINLFNDRNLIAVFINFGLIPL